MLFVALAYWPFDTVVSVQVFWIRLVTYEVTDEFEGSTQATAGNYFRWGLEGIFDIPWLKILVCAWLRQRRVTMATTPI